MAFYKALENVELKKYSEASPLNFKVIFYSKVLFKSTKLFDKEIKAKVSNYFDDDSKSSLMISKEFSDLNADILFVRDFDNKKSAYKRDGWLASLFVALDKYGVQSANIYVDTTQQFKDKNFVFELVKTAEKATYRYTDTNPNTKKESTLKNVEICVEKSSAALKRSVELGLNVGRGANTARNLGNRPANHATPTYIADQIKALAKEIGGFKVKVLEEEDMEKLGMGSLLSVSRGSVEPAKLVTMEYHGGKKGGKPVVLVGKGVTFDTGGISLKPGAKMDEMKWDMSGAGSVIGTMCAVAASKIPVNLVCAVGLTENMPAGNATKPGDVVTSMSGQTIEILNTDAEGRLVLCDVLTYIGKYNPKYVVDVATLTGAVIVALGSVAAGVMGNDQKLVDNILEAGQATGEKAWQLPLWDEYQTYLHSNFADMANIAPGRAAGTIEGGCFISRFTEDYKWAHLDIAGVADIGDGKNKGSTGKPVGLLFELVNSNR
ncbi:MAG: leucyl aminopeptidase [SAR86 cluster bacterium]|uniref:Probable cytosol aminopeptidase n=1 Tax=SAR86 cluster bacterium TaxID=2030880 RepID=A0A937LL45_9GAMM|nr:leucyl aminopeptidase [SAR86 cluster bacterium]